MSEITKCMFPAAGYGTRFLPVTKSMPKEMLPIVSKPLIQFGVEEALQAGLTGMAIVTGRGKRAIEDHFDISYELEDQIRGTGKEDSLSDIRDIINRATISYTRQIRMNGLGHAILTGETLIGDAPFAVLLADDLCVVESKGGGNGEGDGVLAQMVKLYNTHHCSIVAIEEVPADQTNQYGIISADDTSGDFMQVNDMVEKPDPADAPSNLAIIGRYILTPDIFDILRDTKPGKGGEIQITDALLTQAKAGGVYAYKFKGRRFDCGSIEGYMEAINHVYQHAY